LDRPLQRGITESILHCHSWAVGLICLIALIIFFNCTLIVVLVHMLFVTFLKFVYVPFAGRRRWPIAVEHLSNNIEFID